MAACTDNREINGVSDASTNGKICEMDALDSKWTSSITSYKRFQTNLVTMKKQTCFCTLFYFNNVYVLQS